MKSEKIDELLGKNKKAWDKSSEDYVKYCKTYYINLVLTNRLQQMIEQRKDLISRLESEDKI